MFQLKIINDCTSAWASALSEILNQADTFLNIQRNLFTLKDVYITKWKINNTQFNILKCCPNKRRIQSICKIRNYMQINLINLKVAAYPTYILFLSATSNISTAESSKPCIVVEERGTADSYTGTTVPSPSRSKYLILTLTHIVPRIEV